MKFFTLSYDDGVYQDLRFLDMMNRYGIRGTFNLNSNNHPEEDIIPFDGDMLKAYSALSAPELRCRRLSLGQLKEAYKGHEIALHGYRHPRFTELTEDEIKENIALDKKILSAAVGHELNGMAYPFGAHNETVIRALQSQGVRYCRDSHVTHTFDFPENPMTWHSTCKHTDPDLMKLAEAFLKADEGLFYIYGHTYEFDYDDGIWWETMENFLRFMSGHDDICYATGSEIMDYLQK